MIVNTSSDDCKKIKKLIPILTCIIIFLIIQTFVHGISMSSFVEKDLKQVEKGGTTQFDILFWNPSSNPFRIRLRAIEVPEELIVIIIPNDFMLNSSLVTKFPADKGKHYMNTQYGLMETTPVKVIVKVPKMMELKNYDVFVKATAGNPSRGISTLLEKTFKFTVEVTSPPTLSEGLGETTGRISETIGDISSGITGMTAAGPATNLVLLIISVILLAFVIWFIRFR